jgi:hypothetical protein
MALAVYEHVQPKPSTTVPLVRPALETYSLNLDPEAPLATATPVGSSVAVAPDGSKVVYCGRNEGFMGLYWRKINEPQFTLIPQTVRAMPGMVFSPQSDRLAFFSREGDVEILSFEGGLPRKICDAGGMVYGEDL